MLRPQLLTVDGQGNPPLFPVRIFFGQYLELPEGTIDKFILEFIIPTAGHGGTVPVPPQQHLGYQQVVTLF